MKYSSLQQYGNSRAIWDERVSPDSRGRADSPTIGSLTLHCGVHRINEVAQRWARLVLGWVTIFAWVYNLKTHLFPHS